MLVLSWYWVMARNREVTICYGSPSIGCMSIMCNLSVQFVGDKMLDGMYDCRIAFGCGFTAEIFVWICFFVAMP